MDHRTQTTHEFSIHETSGVFPQQVLVVHIIVSTEKKQVLCKFFNGREIVYVYVTVGWHNTLVLRRMCPEDHWNDVITKTWNKK